MVVTGVVPMPFSVVVILVIIGVFEVTISILVQRKVGNPKRMREIQIKMSKVSKDMKEMMKSKASQESIMQKQREIMPLANESMKMSLKPMLIIFPFFMFMYYGVVGIMLKGWSMYKINFIVPLGYEGFFIVSVFILGLIAGISVSLYDRKKMKEEREAVIGST